MRGILTIGLIGGLLFLSTRAWGAVKLGQRAVVRTLNTRISKITLAGLTLATDLFVDNPTNGSVQVTRPVVTFLSGGKYIASSVPSKELFTISPLNQTSLGTVKVDISWSALTPYIANLISRIPALARNTNTSLKDLNLPLEYKYSLYVNDLFYESTPQPLA